MPTKPYDHIITRKEWGAAPPNGRRIHHDPSSIVIHHTVYPTLSTKASKSLESARMRDIQRQHQNQGWLDFAYHLAIFPSGRVYRGRPLDTIGSHVANNNTGRVGIVFDGNYETGKPSEEALRTARYLLKHHDKLRYMRPVLAHRDFGGTSCPGKNLMALTNEF